MDDTGTEVDEEVFSDILEEKSDILWTILDVHSVTGKWLYDYFVYYRVTVFCHKNIRFSPVSSCRFFLLIIVCSSDFIVTIRAHLSNY